MRKIYYIIFITFLLILSIFIFMHYLEKQVDHFTRINELAVIVHTCDKYQNYWPPFLYFFQRYFPIDMFPVFFANEDLMYHLPHNITGIHTGTAEWGTRLQRAVTDIPEQYILYLQEDIWFTAPISSHLLNNAVDFMTAKDLNYLGLQKNCQHQIFEVDRVDHPAWYLISHQPGIWKKSFLIGTLQTFRSNLSPLQHETWTNQYLHRNPDVAERCQCFVQYLHYEEVSRRGQLQENGKKLLKKYLTI